MSERRSREQAEDMPLKDCERAVAFWLFAVAERQSAPQKGAF